MDEDEIIAALERKLKKATDLLREWRDKYGGQAVHRFGSYERTLTASPSDLLRDTNRVLEGRYE